MKIDCICIDFWNTLYDSSNGEGRNQDRFLAIAAQLQRLGQTRTKEELAAGQQKVWEYFRKHWFAEQRTPTTDEMVAAFWCAIDIEADSRAIEEVSASFAEGILRFPPALIDGAAAALAELSDIAPLAIVSDTAFSPGRILRQIMQQDGIEKHFSAFSFSDETGVSKPHPKAFLTALELTGAAAASSLHIGDIEKTDIAGAKSLGMIAIRFEGDPSAIMNKENPELSAADYRAGSWSEVANTIRFLQ